MTSTRPPNPPGGSRHASPDGSFGRSVASAGGRGGALVLAAVVLGIVLLQTSDDGDQAVIADGRLTEVGQLGVDVDVPTTGGSTTSSSPDDGTGTGSTADSTPPATDSSGQTLPTDTLVPPPNRAEIAVRVYNAASIQGIAGAQSDLFTANGYAVQVPGNADTDLEQTRIYFAEGFQASCELVRGDLVQNNPNAPALAAVTTQPVDPALMPVAGYEEADCIVVVGADIADTTG